MLDELHIFLSEKTPEFLFSPDGMLKIRGRGLFQNKNKWVSYSSIEPLNNSFALSQSSSEVPCSPRAIRS